MRLLNVTTLELREFYGDEIPPYVTASHRWSNDETTFKDVSKKRNLHSVGYEKVRGFCKYILQRNDGNRSKFLDTIGLARNCEWLWIDTACINKNSSSEVSEAVNSMYDSYSKSEVCYAYLPDVASAAPYEHAIMDFMRSEWFRRGWTLQELLAPKVVVFLSRDWTVLGHKCSLDACDISCGDRGPGLNTKIAKITKIQVAVLRSPAQISDYDVLERKQWAADRLTTKPEDRAYCLIGIMGVNMLPIYGEGDNAWARLEDELAKLNARKAREQRLRRRETVVNANRRSNNEAGRNTFAPYDRYVATEASRARNSYRNTREALDLQYETDPPRPMAVDLTMRRLGTPPVYRERGRFPVEESAERGHRRRARYEQLVAEDFTQADPSELKDRSGRGSSQETINEHGAHRSNTVHVSSEKQAQTLPPSGAHEAQHDQQHQRLSNPRLVQSSLSLTPPPTPPEHHGFRPQKYMATRDAHSGHDHPILPTATSAVVDNENLSDESRSISMPRSCQNANKVAVMSANAEDPQESLPVRRNSLRPSRRRPSRPVSMAVPDSRPRSITKPDPSPSTPSARLPPCSLAGYMDLFHAAAAHATRALSFPSEQGVHDLTEDHLAYGEIE